jgi:Ca2+-binding EF-hand superfamily protein
MTREYHSSIPSSQEAKKGSVNRLCDNVNVKKAAPGVFHVENFKTEMNEGNLTHSDKAKQQQFLSDKSIKRLFDSVAHDKEGYIDAVALENLSESQANPHSSKNLSKRLRQRITQELLMEIRGNSTENRINLGQFQSFIRRKEAQLFQIFNEVDSNGSGYLDSVDVKRAFHQAGSFRF